MQEVDDRIVYVLVSNGGGVDGRDSSDRGGAVRFASTSRAEAERRLDGHSTLQKRVIDFVETRQRVLAKMDPVERLVLEDLVNKAKLPRREWDHSEGNRG